MPRFLEVCRVAGYLVSEGVQRDGLLLHLVLRDHEPGEEIWWRGEQCRVRDELFTVEERLKGGKNAICNGGKRMERGKILNGEKK